MRDQGGGTLVVAGSHRLLNINQFVSSKDVKRRLKDQPYFEELLREGDPGDRMRFLTEVGRLDDVELQIVELTGEPGVMSGKTAGAK